MHHLFVECNVVTDQQLACGSGALSSTECHDKGCCYSLDTQLCYYPMDGELFNKNSQSCFQGSRVHYARFQWIIRSHQNARQIIILFSRLTPPWRIRPFPRSPSSLLVTDLAHPTKLPLTLPCSRYRWMNVASTDMWVFYSYYASVCLRLCIHSRCTYSNWSVCRRWVKLSSTWLRSWIECSLSL